MAPLAVNFFVLVLSKELLARVIVFRILSGMFVVTGSALRGVALMITDFCVMALNVADEW